MKAKSIQVSSFIVIILILFLTVGCPHSPGQGNDLVPDSNGEINYKFKISNFPYGSEGQKVVAVINKDDNISQKEIGTVSSNSTYLEKTVKLPFRYDQFEIRFLDSSNRIKYYVPIDRSVFYNEQTGVYEVDGDYYYYYTTTPYSISEEPKVATTESKIQELQLGTRYNFNSTEEYYKIWHISNAMGKVIKITKEGFDNKADLYVSSRKNDIMSYSSQSYTGDNIECNTTDVYIMLRPKMYFSIYGAVTCSVTFMDISAEIPKCLEIDKSIMASDGKIYASGKCSSNTSKGILWCINPSDRTKTQVTNFHDDIIGIRELEEGILYISYNTCISTYNLATREISTLVSDLSIQPKTVIPYKDNKLVAVGRRPSASYGDIVLIEKNTGRWKAFDYIDHQLSLGNMDLADDLFYFPDLNFFVHSTKNITPKDICFTVFDSDTIENATYHSCYSELSGGYDMESPLKVISTSPVKVLSAGGCVFRIDKDLIDSVSTDDEDYYDKIENWIVYEGTPYRSYTDCIFTDDYIYYMNYHLESYNLEDAYCSIEKCSVNNPKEVIHQEIYENEIGIQLYSYDGKIYLLTNGTRAIYQRQYVYDYQVFLHEINY